VSLEPLSALGLPVCVAGLATAETTGSPEISRPYVEFRELRMRFAINDEPVEIIGLGVG
jgi:hypothetical protein